MSEKLEKIRKVFGFADLSKYSFKDRLIIRVAGLAFYFLIRILGKTVRFEVEGWENVEQIERDGKQYILSIWHNRIFLSVYFWRNRQIVPMASQSFDGDIIARFLKRLGYGVARGSSSRGGVQALGEMIFVMKKGFPTCITVDGPRGPKYIVKIGASLLAKKTGQPMLPSSIEIKKFWTVKSWDNLQIPKPFSRAKVFISQPIYVPDQTNDEEIENKRLELQNSLDELVKRGVQWRESEK